jgi:phage tail-like protein
VAGVRRELLDSGGTKVTSWKLAGVYPAKWTGPTLDTGTNQVALEVLELVHNGFTR